MTYRETAIKVYELHNMGATYKQIAAELGLSPDQAFIMGSADIRSDVWRHCDDCGKEWHASVFPWQRYTFHRCVECAASEWPELTRGVAGMDYSDRSGCVSL